MNFFEGDMREGDRRANAGVIFYPAREPYAPLVTCPAGAPGAGGTDETYGPPCVEIGGVQVYVYVRAIRRPATSSPARLKYSPPRTPSASRPLAAVPIARRWTPRGTAGNPEKRETHERPAVGT
jgi:hypothetical protein